MLQATNNPESFPVPMIPPKPTPLDLIAFIGDVNDTIAGHLHPLEGIVLFTLAASLPARAKVVELGPLVGKSTTMLATGLLSGQGGHVFAVDLFSIPAGGSVKAKDFMATPHATLDNDYKLSHLFENQAQLEVFGNNIASIGLSPFVEAIVDESAQAARHFHDRTVDMIFVDASHEYEDVRADLIAWLPKIKSGGLIVCHEHVDAFPGVVRAVGEVLQQGNDVTNCYQVHSLLVGRKV